MADKIGGRARVGLYLKRLYFISSGIAYCISPYASFYAGLSCYKCLKHALCSSNNVLLSVASLCKLSKEFKTFKIYVAAPCEIEFCSAKLLQQSVRRRFEQSLL